MRSVCDLLSWWHDSPGERDCQLCSLVIAYQRPHGLQEKHSIGVLICVLVLLETPSVGICMACHVLLCSSLLWDSVSTFPLQVHDHQDQEIQVDWVVNHSGVFQILHQHALRWFGNLDYDRSVKRFWNASSFLLGNETLEKQPTDVPTFCWWCVVLVTYCIDVEKNMQSVTCLYLSYSSLGIPTGTRSCSQAGCLQVAWPLTAKTDGPYTHSALLTSAS